MEDDYQDVSQDDMLLAIGRSIIPSPALKKMLPESKVYTHAYMNLPTQISKDIHDS